MITKGMELFLNNRELQNQIATKKLDTRSLACGLLSSLCVAANYRLFCCPRNHLII